MITIENLSYGYTKRKLVLSGVNTQFAPGHVYGLLGKNGIGKTTLLRLMCGLLHGKGAILIDGLCPQLRQVELLQRVRLVSEMEELPPLKVLTWAKAQSVFYPNFSMPVLHQCLREFEVDGRQRLTDLSMGQRKKAIIAVALACQTPYLLMDEPTNGLDIPSKAVFRRLVASMMTPERTIIVSTHQVDDLENVIDALVVMDGLGVTLNRTLDEVGRRVVCGTPAEGDEVLYSEPTVRGVQAVMRNTSGVDAPVDVKLFFTAAVTNPQAINSLFAD